MNAIVVGRDCDGTRGRIWNKRGRGECAEHHNCSGGCRSHWEAHREEQGLEERNENLVAEAKFTTHSSMLWIYI